MLSIEPEPFEPYRLGRVRIPFVVSSARGAVPLRLAEREACVNLAALSAQPARREPFPDVGHVLAAGCHLLFQTRPEGAESVVGHGFAEAQAACLRLHVQRLEGDEVERVGYPRRLLLRPVTAHVGDPLMDAADPELLLPPVVRAFFHAREPALLKRKALLGFSVRMRRVRDRAVRADVEMRGAVVEADGAGDLDGDGLRGVEFHEHAREVSPCSVARDGHRFDAEALGDAPVGLAADKAQLRKADGVSLHPDVAAHERGGVTLLRALARLPFWEPHGLVAPEVAESLLQVHLLVA